MQDFQDLKQAKTSRPLIPEITNRWSPRAFSEKPVEDQDLRALLEAAQWAASSSNQQPWRFIVARQGDSHYEKLSEGMVEGNKVWASRAPVLMATVVRKNVVGKDFPNPHARHDLGLAVGNLSAQATHLGLSLHQMAGIIPENIERSFALDPDQYEVVTMIALGYHDPSRIDQLKEGHAQSEKAPRERQPLEELVFGEEFGRPAPFLRD